MDIKHHCNGCPHWYVTQKKYPSGFYDITICRKYGKQIYYLAGDKNRTPYPCSICEKEFSYVPYMEQELLQEVEKMTERLSDRNPCTNCKADRQIGNPNRWQCECDRYDKPNDWKNECVKKLAEYENAEEEGRLVVLLCKVGDTVYVIEDSHIEVFEVNKIELNHKVFGNATYYLEKPSRRGCLYKYYDSEFGDKWFVDREEAEKALREMEEKS